MTINSKFTELLDITPETLHKLTTFKNQIFDKKVHKLTDNDYGLVSSDKWTSANELATKNGLAAIIAHIKKKNNYKFSAILCNSVSFPSMIPEPIEFPRKLVSYNYNYVK